MEALKEQMGIQAKNNSASFYRDSKVNYKWALKYIKEIKQAQEQVEPFNG